MIPVVEIFGPTVQGEGPNAGARCIFVRVKGCDFSCDFCDSKFTWGNNSSEVIKYNEEDLSNVLVDLMKVQNCSRVVLTGGNPCLYDFEPVINSVRDKLRLRGSAAFDVETQGSKLPGWLLLVDTVVFSPKPPSSNMSDTYDDIVDYIGAKAPEGQQIAIKVPIFTDEDIEFARRYAQFINRWTNVHDNELKLYLSVGNSDVDTTESIRDRVLSDYELLLNKINENPEDFNNVFILPQIHTLVWGNKQGV